MVQQLGVMVPVIDFERLQRDVALTTVGLPAAAIGLGLVGVPTGGLPLGLAATLLSSNARYLVEPSATRAIVRVDVVERIAQQVREMWEWMRDAFADLGRVLVEAGRSIVSFAERAQLVPGPVTGHRHGERWTSPWGGEWQVRGRRGRPSTYHWALRDPGRSRVGG